MKYSRCPYCGEASLVATYFGSEQRKIRNSMFEYAGDYFSRCPECRNLSTYDTRYMKRRRKNIPKTIVTIIFFLLFLAMVPFFFLSLEYLLVFMLFLFLFLIGFFYWLLFV